MKRNFTLGFLTLIILAGCEDSHVKNLEETNFQLQKQNQQLEKQLQDTQTANKQLKTQVDTLSQLPAKVRLDSLPKLQSVKITRFTNLYDKDKDGTKEKLIVYLQPIDEQGDAVKAAGAADVELWNLNKDAPNARLGKWRIEPAELKKLWFLCVAGAKYRLIFDIAEVVKSFNEPLIVKVTFTDHLSGKVFEEQTVIKP